MADTPEITLEELNEALEKIGTNGRGPIAPHGETVVEEYEENDHCIKNGAYIRLSDDNMIAWIYLNPPKEGESFYTKSQIIEFMREYDVVKGYHYSNIAAIAKKHVYGREIVVAKGAEPVDGVDGYYEWKVDIVGHKSPTVREDGSVDYSSMSEVTSVQEGDVIAVYHRAKQPKNGYNVLGKETPAKAAKDEMPLKGRGVSNDNDPDIYVATTTGKVEYKDRTVDIKNVYEIRGDVDLITGKIEFFGDVEISGSVESGVIIRASRNVMISGHVEAANIYAGGDVVIKGGISGGQKATITAKGDVCADFIEHTTVTAGGNVRANSFIGSTVDSRGTVMAEGKNGSIIAGYTRGLFGVAATDLGNDAETKTYVASGYTGEEYTRYLELFQQESETQQILSDTVEEMSAILKRKRLGQETDKPDDDEALLSLNEKKDKYFDMLDKVRSEKEALAAVIEAGKGSSISVNNKAYRGVTVAIEGTPFKIEETTMSVRYTNEAGRIVNNVSGTNRS